jgi:hypothetical protein
MMAPSLSEHGTSGQSRPSWLTAVLAAVVLSTLGAAFVVLERSRARERIAADVKLWKADDGTIRGVQFVTSDVTDDHWGLLEDAGETLQSVNLSNTEQVAGGLQRLAKFPNLRDLYLVDCGWVDDAEVAHIAKSHRLRSLDISGTPLTDEGVRQFDLAELGTLTADRCNGLTEETFEMLIALDSVKSVSLKGVPISLDQFERLRIERPDMAIFADPPQLTWERVQRLDLITTPVDWLSDETDIDQFLRYFRLPHNWVLGSFDENARARYLNLGGPGVAHCLPAILEGMTEIESLILVDTRLDGGLQHVSPSTISLWMIQLHAASHLDGLEAITWLNSVFVRDADLTSEQWVKLFDVITANELLRGLTLSGAQVPAGAIARLRDHRELRHLWLIDTQITDADLQAIGEIPSLEILDTANIPISDAVVESWMQLPKLNYLNIYQGGVRPEMAERLHRRFPEAQVRVH